MKKWKQAITPALCFLAGFLICIMVAPMIQGSSDGDTYYTNIEPGSFWNIYLNNTMMCCLFILGCGIGSCILLLIQGFTFGGIYLLWIAMGNTAKHFFLLFLPHVFFEFIAMTLAGYLGFRLLDFLMKKNGRTVKGLIREHKWILLTTFACVLVGAVVECYVTPALYTIT